MKPNQPYPHFLITVERWAARRSGRRARELQQFLATLRLNSVIGGLLQSIYFQAHTGSFAVQPARTPSMTPGEYDLARLRAQVAHSVGALNTIELFVYNELKQRGLLHLVGESQPRDVPRLSGGVRELPVDAPWTEPAGNYRPLRVVFANFPIDLVRDADYVFDRGVPYKDRDGRFDNAGGYSNERVLDELARDHDGIEYKVARRLEEA
jgi:hypothetical protein